MSKVMHLVNAPFQDNFVPPNMELSKITELDRKMSHILDRKDLSEQQKVILYDQVLLEYKHLLDKGKFENMTTSASNSKTEEILNNDSEDIKFESIDNSRIRDQAKQFLDYLKSRNIIRYNRMGQILDKQGRAVKNSNIIDILEDSLRSRKNRPIPIGSVHFFKALKEFNVPRGFIKNRERLPLLDEKFISNEENESHTSTSKHKQITPLKKKRRRNPTEEHLQLDWINLPK